MFFFIINILQVILLYTYIMYKIETSLSTVSCQNDKKNMVVNFFRQKYNKNYI